LRRVLMLSAGAALLAVPALTAITSSTASAASTTYQAESSANTLAGGAKVATCSSCSGGKIVKQVGKTGTLQFNGVSAAAAGSEKITISYIEGNTTSRTAQLVVNGGTAKTVTFKYTGSWSTVGTVSTTVTLKAGANTLKFSNATGWAPDFDKISVAPASSPSPTPSPSPTGGPGGGGYGAIPADQALESVNTTKKEVAITLDDGPQPWGDAHTSDFVNLLKAKGAYATFFLIGNQISVSAPDPASENMVKSERDAGFAIGNHTWTHACLTDDDASGVQSEVTQTQAKIKSVTGLTPKIMRPPSGCTNATINKQLRGLNLVPILWSIDPEDWTTPGSDVIYQRVVSQIKPGAIILMHDGGGFRQQSLDALSRILDYLKSHGYATVSIDQLLADGTPVTAPECC
jgi:peptidoglycan/xylan/chitin deacetylase (PgdA/CDA1 family)